MIIQCFFSILNDYLIFSMSLGPRGPGTSGTSGTRDLGDLGDLGNLGDIGDDLANAGLTISLDLLAASGLCMRRSPWSIMKNLGGGKK